MLKPEQVLRFVLKSYIILFNRSCAVSGDHRPPSGPKIIAMNHTIRHEPIHLTLMLEELPHFLLQDGLFNIPLVGQLLRASGQIPVCRGTEKAADSVATACALLRSGKTLAIFPEGRCVQAGERVQAKTGAVRMALETGAPIIPLGLYVPPKYITDMIFRSSSPGRPWGWQFFGESYMRFGDAYLPNNQCSAHAQAQELMDRIYSLVAEAERESKYASQTGFNPITQWPATQSSRPASSSLRT